MLLEERAATYSTGQRRRFILSEKSSFLSFCRRERKLQVDLFGLKQNGSEKEKNENEGGVWG